MQYGFVIDQEKCIGCHACTVACKQENDVPVGAFRTWVKYTERGKYPEVRRHFAVLRCNQCTKPPCVDICPVNALFKRPDGIVDVDRDACIGCRACMQACPYDALYINDDLGAVEKCHFCAHRVEKGLQPACVTVCPVEAIIPGDFHDPNSKVSLIRKERVLSARRLEQKTGPNVFYIGAHEPALKPGSLGKPETFLWSERPPHRKEPWPKELAVEKDARDVLNAEHKVEWGWPVAAYLVTKGIAGGTAMLAPFLPMLGIEKSVPWWYPETVALVFTLITVFLLVEDLKKPMHFYKLFTRPNWKSWLVKGGIILTAFGVVTALILVLQYQSWRWYETREFAGPGPAFPSEAVERLRWLNAIFGALTAGYTAFLFWQCMGRDLWESRLLLPHLLVQAILCGSLMLVPFESPFFKGVNWDLARIVWLATILHLLFVSIERSFLHRTDNARQGAAFLGTVRALGIPLLVCAACVSAGSLFFTIMPMGWPLLIAGIVGLYLWELAYVRAGQLPPLS